MAFCINLFQATIYPVYEHEEELEREKTVCWFFHDGCAVWMVVAFLMRAVYGAHCFHAMAMVTLTKTFNIRERDLIG